MLFCFSFFSLAFSVKVAVDLPVLFRLYNSLDVQTEVFSQFWGLATPSLLSSPVRQSMRLREPQLSRRTDAEVNNQEVRNGCLSEVEKHIVSLTA